MSRVLVLARFDLHRQWREGGPLVVGAVLSLLLAAAALDGVWRADSASATTRALSRRQAASHDEIRELAAQGPSTDGPVEWNARNADFVANDRGTLAIAAPPPLLTLSVGRSDLYPNQVKVTAAGLDAATTAAEIANPRGLATGPFDVAFVLVYLFPMALVAVTFDLLGSERERGTLRLLVAQPVPPAAIVGAFALARGSPIVLIALVVPVAVGAFSEQGLPAGRLVLWSATVAAYGLFWLAVAVWAAVRARSAGQAAAWLSGAWLLFTLVIPTGVNIALQASSQVPSGVMLADSIRAATRDALSDGSRVMGHFLEDHPTASAVGRDGLRQYALLQAARDREVARRLEPVMAQYEGALTEQRRIVALTRILSPALLAADALEQAAGTSRDRFRHMAAQVDQFRASWRQTLMPMIVSAEALTAADADRLPAFRFEEEGWVVVARRMSLTFVALSMMAAALAVAGFIRATRSPLGGPQS